MEFKRVAQEENLKAAAEAALTQIQDKKYRDKVTGYDTVTLGLALKSLSQDCKSLAPKIFYKACYASDF